MEVGPQLRRIMQGITYSRSLSTGWKPPLKVRKQSEEQAQELRDRFHIIVEGQHLLPPILDFGDMKFPQPVLRQLAAKGISRPTPIQMQVRSAAASAPIVMRRCCGYIPYALQSKAHTMLV